MLDMTAATKQATRDQQEAQLHCDVFRRRGEDWSNIEKKFAHTRFPLEKISMATSLEELKPLVLKKCEFKKRQFIKSGRTHPSFWTSNVPIYGTKSVIVQFTNLLIVYYCQFRHWCKNSQSIRPSMLKRISWCVNPVSPVDNLTYRGSLSSASNKIWDFPNKWCSWS